MKFIFSKNTEIQVNGKDDVVVKNAVDILKRDMKQVFINANCRKNKIIIYYDSDNTLEGEKYQIIFSNENTMIIKAKGALGAVYAILFISRKFLKIPDFWYWLDWKYSKAEFAEVEIKDYVAPSYAIKYRGWFINDEVLLTGAASAEKREELFKMVFETCLRCGGNMIIPGTDRNSKQYRALAADMGLAITHHHAEPLGAEMFARVYPEKEASYIKYPEQYKVLWSKAVKEQSNYKVIWNLGFRGQGDKAFWEDEQATYTDEEKGKLISAVINAQYEIIVQSIKNPVCCTNMYGETLDLYSKGYLKIPDKIIKIWADNGYGKMVSRRQGNKNLRIPSMPYKEDKGLQGIYYHASFYDLQASNHLTMLPNSNELISSELREVISHNLKDYWIINCGNVKPQVYYLDLISNYWRAGYLDLNKHCLDFTKEYFGRYAVGVSQCINAFGLATIDYGLLDDEHAGEQIYHHTVRAFLNKWFKEEREESVSRLVWLTGDIGYENQLKFFYKKCLEALPRFKELSSLAHQVKASMGGIVKKRFEDFMELQIILHESGIKGSIKFCESFFYYQANEILKAFIAASEAKEYFEEGLAAMKKAEHGKWKEFYENDCLTNVSLTVEMMDTLRAYLRIIGDGPNLYGWERRYLLSDEEKRIMLLTNTKKHLTDDELANNLKIKYKDN